MKIYTYTVQQDIIQFRKHAFIADDDDQAKAFIADLRERLLATGEAEAISGPIELNQSSLIELIVPVNLTGKPYRFKEFKCEIEEDPDRKSWHKRWEGEDDYV